MKLEAGAVDGKRAGVALRRAREAVGWSQRLIAKRLGRAGHTVHRWEVKGVVPTLETRIALLQLLAHAPRPLLDDLARYSGIALDPVRESPAPASAGARVPGPSDAMAADAQRLVDDAVREAAEDLNVSPRKLRPALKRLLDRVQNANVTIDAAARMVLGAPKSET